MPLKCHPLPTDADRVVISVNPKAGRRPSHDRVSRLAEMLTERGMNVEVDSSLSSVAQAAIDWHTQGRLRALIGVGGDGTAAELANRTPPGLPLAMLPSGNENLLARYVGWRKSPDELCQTLFDGQISQLDAGCANGRLFLLMAGCGFDAEVVRRVHSERTGHIRTRNYFKPILHSIRSYQYPEMKAVYQVPEQTAGTEVAVTSAGKWFFVFNLPCYGGGLRIAPEADGFDGMLDICLFQRGRFWNGIRYTGGILLRRHHRMQDVVMQRVRRLTVSADAEVPFQLDGDPGGVLPLEIEAIPQRLTLVVPRNV